MGRRRRVDPVEAARLRIEQARAAADLLSANRVPLGIAAGGAALAALSLYPKAGHHVGRGVGILAANVARGILDAGGGLIQEIAEAAAPPAGAAVAAVAEPLVRPARGLFQLDLLRAFGVPVSSEEEDQEKIEALRRGDFGAYWVLVTR